MATAQEQCTARGMGFDSGNSLCVVNDRSQVDAGGYAYYDPETGARVTAPYAASDPANISWPQPKPAVIQTISPPIQTTTAAPAAGLFDNISSFLTQPALFGLPMWAIIALLAGGAFVLYSLDSGGKKKGGGIF